MTDSSRQSLFEKWAASYDSSVFNQQDFPFAGYDRVLDTIIEQGAIRPEMSVLDLGTGTGNLAERLAAQTSNIVGVDFSDEMLVQARRKVPDGTFLPLDLTADDWSVLAPYRFDRVVAAYVLHEFPLDNVVEMMRRLRTEYTTADSRIVIGDIAFPSVAIREQAAEHWGGKWDSDEHYFAADVAGRAFQAAGWRTDYQQISSCAGVFLLEPE